jgi:hypothetical protein
MHAYPEISAYLAGTSIEWTIVRLRDKTICSGRFYIAIKSIVRTTRRTDRGTSWYITRLLASVTRTFWWPNMKRAMQHYVRICVTCQRNKASRHKPYELL